LHFSDHIIKKAAKSFVDIHHRGNFGDLRIMVVTGLQNISQNLIFKAFQIPLYCLGEKP
jgi:hypothetical protein